MGDLEKDILKTDLDKDTLKAFITGTIGAIAQKKSFEECVVMIQTLEGEIENLRRIAESKKKGKEYYAQDSTLFKIIYGKDGSKTFAPIERKKEYDAQDSTLFKIIYGKDGSKTFDDD